MNNAYIGKVLRVDLATGEVNEEALREEWLRKYIGGSGLATKYLYDETSTGNDPLGEENPLIFMTGPLTGTSSASASRYSVVAKSPLTGIWGQANSGGSFGPMLKRSGYDGIIFERNSSRPVYLKIVNGNAELCDAEHIWGKTVSETEDTLISEVGERTVVASIGPAGENLVRYSAIMNNKHRAAGRCGLGAVMGAKRLKAIACFGNTPINLFDEKAFRMAVRRQNEYLDESMMKVVFDAFGTNMVSDMVNVRGGYPTHNWKEGVFEQIEEVNAQAITDKVLVDGVRCFACPVACGRGTEIREGKYRGHSGEGPEYETTNVFGSLCGVSDLNAITMANYLCNDYGLDTISTGSTIAFALECYEKGILDLEMTGGVELKFNEPDLVVEMVEKIARREGIGDLLAEGTRLMAKQLGQGSENFAMNVKGLELPAYDPRSAKICGLAYVTANRGGDHITGYIEGPTFVDAPFLLIDDSFIADPFVANPEETKVVVDLENALTMLDALGGCKFMGMVITADEIVELIKSATGWDYSVEEFRKSGERIYNLVRVYCARDGGINRGLDVLPKRLMEDPLPDGPAKGMVVDVSSIEAMKDAYYGFRGWDIKNGLPTREKLEELELSELITSLWGS